MPITTRLNFAPCHLKRRNYYRLPRTQPPKNLERKLKVARGGEEKRLRLTSCKLQLARRLASAPSDGGASSGVRVGGRARPAVVVGGAADAAGHAAAAHRVVADVPAVSQLPPEATLQLHRARASPAVIRGEHEEEKEHAPRRHCASSVFASSICTCCCFGC
jgi:allophanate hydrolase subunit 2